MANAVSTITQLLVDNRSLRENLGLRGDPTTVEAHAVATLMGETARFLRGNGPEEDLVAARDRVGETVPRLPTRSAKRAARRLAVATSGASAIQSALSPNTEGALATLARDRASKTVMTDGWWASVRQAILQAPVSASSSSQVLSPPWIDLDTNTPAIEELDAASCELEQTTERVVAAIKNYQRPIDKGLAGASSRVKILLRGPDVHTRKSPHMADEIVDSVNARPTSSANAWDEITEDMSRWNGEISQALHTAQMSIDTIRRGVAKDAPLVKDENTTGVVLESRQAPPEL